MFLRHLEKKTEDRVGGGERGEGEARKCQKFSNLYIYY